MPLQPYIANEVFFEMGGFDFKRNRASIGLTPCKNLTTFYMLEMDFGDSVEHKNIIGIKNMTLKLK